MRITGRSAWTRAAGLVLLLGATALAGCDALLSSEAGLADEATARVTGTATRPLLLITTTRFMANYDNQSGTYVITLLQADTVVLGKLPHTERRGMKGRDRYLARLVNPDSAVTADVRLEVVLDGRTVYNQQALLRDASLEYFTWFSPPRGN